MATTATAVAAAVARARREVRGYFEQRDAFDPSRAVPFDPPRRLHRKQLDQLIGRGVVKQTLDGRYWFDKAAYRLELERRSAAAKQMLLIVAVGLVLAFAAVAVIKAWH